MDVRQFWFFDESDSVLFVRTDAESAQWQVDELTLTCLFPYDPGKLITRGMRIAFEDDDGVLQPFEVRKVRNYPIDEYQEITCEHIVISELTDAHTNEQELTGVTASAALSTILNAQPSGLTGAARWTVGTVTASGTSSGDIGIGSVWQNVRTIETNWNVYILPRVTFNADGITGRYLDIVPADGVWHGVRLSIDKNMDEAGVTVDDTEVKTALFGYGGNAYELKTDNLDKDKEKVTLVGYNWPGHPSGASINSALGYIEDTAATAMYGRNGIPRFGFYQNGDIDSQSVLAQKTWEALQTTNKPTVTVDCMVRDLYRMGYHDEKIRLHDTVMVDLMPMNDILTLEIIQLSVDLLDPTATRPTIGAYVPNIIYIQRRTEERASGGAGGGISGRRGGETESEAEWSEFQAEFVVNNTIMSYHATQVDHDNKVLKAAGLDITAEGVITYATTGDNMIGSKFNQTAASITQEVTNRTNADSVLQSSITQNANQIALKVSKGDVATQLAVELNNVTISNANLVVDGYVTAAAFQAEQARFDNLVSGTTTATSIKATTLYGTNLSCGNLTINSRLGGWSIPDMGDAVIDGNAFSASQLKLDHYHKISMSESGGVVTVTTGKAANTAQTATFNIAATQFYLDAVAAAKAEGVTEGEGHFTLATVTLQGTQHTVTPISGGNYYCLKGSSYTVQGVEETTTLYYKDSDGDYNVYTRKLYRAGTSSVNAASGSYYRYSAGDPLTLYDAGQTYANTYYTKTT